MIDIRSDTVTQPTDAMRKAIAEAVVGDDVYGDDPTVAELEALGAEMTGKEAAVFVPSGTFGNQLALFTWCARGTEAVLGDECHIIRHEAGAASVIAGVQTRTVRAPYGILDADEVRKKLRRADLHSPATSLICMENAHSNGSVVPLSSMKEIKLLAEDRGIPVHLDGARIFNAASALGVPASEIADCADSVMFCLSKGLCAPVGSLLAGSAEFAERALLKRKIMGGGMRQAGFLAAAGIVALKQMTGRVADDHANAKRLAASLSSIPGISVDEKALDINMVFFTAGRLKDGCDAERIVRAFADEGIAIHPPEDGVFRFVTHYWIGDIELEKIIDAARRAFGRIPGGAVLS